MGKIKKKMEVNSLSMAYKWKHTLGIIMWHEMWFLGKKTTLDNNENQLWKGKRIYLEASLPKFVTYSVMSLRR